MPERNERHEALILRAKDSPKGDRIVTMLTPEAGLIDAFIFGGHKSGLRSSASPYVHGDAFIYSDPVCHSRTLSDFFILDSYPGLRESYDKLKFASLMAEFLMKTSSCGGEYATMLSLSLDTLHAMNDSGDASTRLLSLAWLWKSLDVMGLQPGLDVCASCQGPLEGEKIRYDQARDGFVCRNCHQTRFEGEENAAACLPELAQKDLSLLASCTGTDIPGCAGLCNGSSDPDGRSLAVLEEVVHMLVRNAAEGSLMSLDM
jgi:DNA repair protein RecO